MTRRFTETDKWQDDWFLSLPLEASHLFMYLCDNCDVAGFWIVDYDLASHKTKLPREGTLLIGGRMTLEDAFEECRAKLIWREDGRVLYIKNFLKHQGNWPVSRNSNAPYMRGIVKRFDVYGDFGVHVWNVLQGQVPKECVSDLVYGADNPLRKSFETLSKGLANPIGKGNGKKGGAGGKHPCRNVSTGGCVGPGIYLHGDGTAHPWWLCEAHEAAWKVQNAAKQQVLW